MFGTKFSEETKKKMSAAQKGVSNHFFGKKHTPESIKKMKKHHRGMSGKKHKESTKEKMSRIMTGRKMPWSGKYKHKPHTEEQKKKISESLKGRNVSLETRRKISKSLMGHLGIKGEKNKNWRGGITGWQNKIRTSAEYKLWRKSVFERDNFACIWCGDNRGGNLNADHIKPFSLFPELRFAIDNGRTLCIPCHRTTDSYGRGVEFRTPEALALLKEKELGLKLNKLV